jgi:hypothetical protein
VTRSTDLAIDTWVDFAGWMVRAWSDRLGSLGADLAAPGYTADAAARDVSELALLWAGSAASLVVAVVDSAEYLGTPSAEPERSRSYPMDPLTTATWPLTLKLAGPLRDEDLGIDLPTARVTLEPRELKSSADTFTLEVVGPVEQGFYEGTVEARSKAGTTIASIYVSLAT